MKTRSLHSGRRELQSDSCLSISHCEGGAGQGWRSGPRSGLRSGLDQKQHTEFLFVPSSEREGGRGSVVAISSLALPRFVVCFVQNHFNLM